jgi:hypothetical protein
VRHHHPEYAVAILDQTFELGRKLLVSGAGRGNLTNSNLSRGPHGFFYGDQEFISSVFHQYTYEDIIHFFKELGAEVYEEQKTGKGKIFPVIDHAKTVRNMLVDVLHEKHITTLCNSSVSDIQKNGNIWHVTTKNQIYTAQNIILAAGGKTYPALGSDGSGYDLAISVGHTIVPPVVSAVPLVSKNALSHFLQGEKARMHVQVYIQSEKKVESVGEVMFTSYGFSGPAILDVSRHISIALHREKVTQCELQLSFFPDIEKHEVGLFLEKRMHKNVEKEVEYVLWGLFTEKIAMGVCATAQLPKHIRVKDMTKTNMDDLLCTLLSYRVGVQDTRGWNEGEFTAGGIDTSQVNPHTLESTKEKGLYFAGEILDVDGPVGGFNLSWSWASGWVAGKLQ